MCVLSSIYNEMEKKYLRVGGRGNRNAETYNNFPFVNYCILYIWCIYGIYTLLVVIICILKSLYFSILALWIIELIEKIYINFKLSEKNSETKRLEFCYYRISHSSQPIRFRDQKKTVVYIHTYTQYIHTYIYTHRGYWDMNQCSVFSR